MDCDPRFFVLARFDSVRLVRPLSFPEQIESIELIEHRELFIHLEIEQNGKLPLKAECTPRVRRLVKYLSDVPIRYKTSIDM